MSPSIRPPANTVDAERRSYEARSLEVADELARYTDWIVGQLRPSIGGRVLEIGAGLGGIASRYVEVASQAVLLEPARNLAAELARRMADRANVRVLSVFVDEVVGCEVDGVDFGEGSFDVAVMVNVLEHIDDDLAALTAVRRLLRPTGRLLVFVPAIPALYNRHDARVGHHRRYTRRTLGTALRATGFAVERLDYFDLLGIVPWFVHGRLVGTDAGTGTARGYDRCVVPVCRVVDRLAGPPVGKNLISVARVPA